MPTENDSQTFPKANGIPTLADLSKQLEAVFLQNKVQNKRLLENTNHVLKLQQTIDPLTWKRRALILALSSAAGGFVGGSVTVMALYKYERMTFIQPAAASMRPIQVVPSTDGAP